MRTRVTELQREQDYVERYSDFDRSFERDPGTGRLKKITNAEAIKQGVENRIRTLFFERFYNPNFGCLVYNSLFEPNDQFAIESVDRTIRNSLQNDARCSIINIDVQSDDETLSISIAVLILIDNTTITIPIIIKKIR